MWQWRLDTPQDACLADAEGGTWRDYAPRSRAILEEWARGGHPSLTLKGHRYGVVNRSTESSRDAHIGSVGQENFNLFYKRCLVTGKLYYVRRMLAHPSSGGSASAALSSPCMNRRSPNPAAEEVTGLNVRQVDVIDLTEHLDEDSDKDSRAKKSKDLEPTALGPSCARYSGKRKVLSDRSVQARAEKSEKSESTALELSCARNSGKRKVSSDWSVEAHKRRYVPSKESCGGIFRAHARDREYRRKERLERGAPRKIRFKPDEDKIILRFACSLSKSEMGLLSKWKTLADRWNSVRPAGGRDANSEQLRRRYKQIRKEQIRDLSNKGAQDAGCCYILGLSIGAGTSCYIGETTNASRRLKKHNCRLSGGSRYCSKLLTEAREIDPSALWKPIVSIRGFPSAAAQSNFSRGPVWRKKFEFKMHHHLNKNGRCKQRLASGGGYAERRWKGENPEQALAQLLRVLRVWKLDYPDQNLEIKWHNSNFMWIMSNLEDPCPYPQTFAGMLF